MKFLSIASLLLAGALASPISPDEPNTQFESWGKYNACASNGLFGTNPNCCGTVLLGAAALNCVPPARTPRSPAEFAALCKHRKPRCCWLDPVGGIVNGICQAPAGFA